MTSQALDRPLVSSCHLAHLLGIPRRELYNVATLSERLYSSFDKVQVNGRGERKTRTINHPRDRLKLIQSRIKERLLDPIPLPAFVLGGGKRRSTKMNARVPENSGPTASFTSCPAFKWAPSATRCLLGCEAATGTTFISTRFSLRQATAR